MTGGLGMVVTGWALVAALFSALACARLLGRRRARPAHGVEPAGDLPAVLLLRPAEDLRARELANLRIPVDYPGALEHVVLSPARPPLPPGTSWLRSDPATANRKVGHLLHALDVLRPSGRVVLAVDADVEVDGRLVAALATAVARGAALATAAPVPLPAPGAGARALRALLCHTHLSFVALDAVAVGSRAICGKAVALGPAALRELAALGDRIGEDLELAARLHRRGAHVELVAEGARIPQDGGVPLGEAVARITRWMQVLRAHRPDLYPTVPCLFAPSLPLLALAVALGAPGPATAVAALWAARTWLARTLGARWGIGWPAGEALLLAAFVCSLRQRTVAWRGRRFGLARGGRMRPASGDAAQ